MLTLQWLLIGASLLVALLALGRSRQLSRRLERLTESYWELRYDYGQLRARISQLEGPAEPAAAGSAAPAAGSTAFVPLSSLKR